MTLGTGGRGPQARSVPQGPAVLVRRRRRLWGFWRLEDSSDSYSFLVGSESDVRHWGPWPAGPVRPSGPCCFLVWRRRRLWGLAAGRQLRQLVFLQVQKVTLGTGSRGPQARALLFWCGEGAVCEAFGGWKTAQTASFLWVQKVTLGTGGRGPQARFVPQGPAGFWQLRQLVFL